MSSSGKKRPTTTTTTATTATAIGNANVPTAWRTNFVKLQAFVAENGHCHVPFKGETRQLAKWTTRQRNAANRLTPIQMGFLDSIDFDWTSKTDREEQAWDAIYSRLQVFRDQEGHCVVPQTYSLDVELGTWVANQRKLDKQGKVRPGRKAKLNSIGFVWVIKQIDAGKKMTHKKYNKKWDEMFVRLQEYKDQHGNCDVPYTYQDSSLALWVSTQRREHNQKTWCGTDRNMRQDRKRRLEEIDFRWQTMLSDESKSGSSPKKKGRKSERVSNSEADKGGEDEASTTTQTVRRASKRRKLHTEKKQSQIASIQRDSSQDDASSSGGGDDCGSVYDSEKPFEEVEI